MATPLREAIETILEEDLARFYMPGHKGQLPFPLGDAAAYDITEIEGADSLYDCRGPILRLEERFSGFYATGASLLSAGGSTLSLQTMLFLVRRLGRGIICARNVHRSAVAAMGLLGLEPYWIPLKQPDEHHGIPGIALPPTVESVDRALLLCPDASAVLITSPDYFGQMADVASIAEVCHRRGKLLLVDNAHGAHLGSFRVALHPMALGADICCDSLHKTLPSLTGAALLHLANRDLYEDAKYAMSLFGSSSPSYLIMMSAEMALLDLETRDDHWLILAGKADELRGLATERGYTPTNNWMRDPARLTLGFKSLGYTADTFGQFVRSMGVQWEYLSDCAAVFLLSPQNTPRDLERLHRVVEAGAFGRYHQEIPPVKALPLPRQRVTISEAMSRPAVFLPTQQAVGRVAARLVSACPPGTTVLVPGEEISPDDVKFLQISGIDTVSVLK